MEGLFPDGKELPVKVISDFSALSDVEIGKIIILKKRTIPGNFCGPETSISHTPALIIHRIVAKFQGQNRFYFWEKGDNDCFPKICAPEDILGIVAGIEGHPDLQLSMQPGIWRKKNKKLLQFYTVASRIYVLITGRNIEINRNNNQNQGLKRQSLIKKIPQKVFWSLFYLICSFLDLKGK